MLNTDYKSSVNRGLFTQKTHERGPPPLLCLKLEGGPLLSEKPPIYTTYKWQCILQCSCYSRNCYTLANETAQFAAQRFAISV